MKAVVYTRYGPPEVLAFRNLPKPQPQAGEILIRVHATSVSRTDCGSLRAQPPLIGRLFLGLLWPKQQVLGLDFAGEVESVGAGVTAYQPGQRVFGMSPQRYGAHAEYLCMPAQGTVAAMPAGLEYSQAVVCEGAWYADTYLQRFGLGAGDSILIYGASGAIGIAAVQLAKARGANVTAVAATRHLELLASLGADRVIDYTAGDFRQGAGSYDFVLDAVGKTTFFRCRQLLKADGMYAATDLGPAWQNLLLALWFSITGRHRVVMPTPNNDTAVVAYLKARMEAGEFRAVVDREYAFADIVEAYRYVETAQKTGIVAIDVSRPRQRHS